MATPIAPTPVLEGKDAEEFLKLDKDESIKYRLSPTPKLEEVRKRMLEDDRNRQE